MRLWEKLLAGIGVAGVIGIIVWRSGLMDRIRGAAHGGSQPQSLPVLMENEEVWEVESDEMGIPQRIVIHRKVVGA